MSTIGGAGVSVNPGNTELTAPLELPAEPGKPLTTQGGNTLDDGSGALTTVGPVQFGPAATHGTLKQYVGSGAAWFGVYSTNSSLYLGMSTSLPAPPGTSCIGGYYRGLGVGGASNATSSPIFGVLTSTQHYAGVGHVAFTITDSNVVSTFNNVLDDGSGNLDAAGHINANPTLPALPTNPPASGTVYQNTTGGPIQIALPVTGGSAADTAQWALGSTDTPGDWGGADTVAASEVKTLHLTVPNNWYWSITTGATIGTADVLGS